MSIKKRVLALAVAGASALVLGGAFSLAGHSTQVSAAGPSTMVVGCAQGNNPADIEFPTSGLPAVAGSTAAGAISGPQEQPFVVLGATAGTAPNVLILNAISLTANSINVLQSGNVLECAALMQDTTPPFAAGAVGPPPGPATCAPLADQDCDVNTVDQGTVTYVLQTAGGRFAINGTTGSTTTSIACAATAPGAPIALGVQSDQCQGAQPATVTRASAAGSAVTPNPALVIKVGFAPGVPLASFGNLSGVAGVNFGFALTASYQRDPTLTAALTTAAVPNAGPSTASATVQLGLLVPTYFETLTANPTTIPAQPNLNIPGVTTPGVAQGGNGQGSTITASLYTGAQPLVVGIGGGATITVGTTTVAGAEPGTVTFTTNNGIFGTPSSVNTSAQQTVAVACGVLPGSNLVFNPTTFSFGSFSFNSCTSATATLFGGGAAGTATVVATFVGSVTGQQAQNAVAVAFSPVPNTVNIVRGCNEVITPSTLAQNTPIATYLGMVSPSSVVVSIWQYNNATQSFNALYFSTAGAPTNGSSVGGGQSVFICASGSATVQNGAF